MHVYVYIYIYTYSAACEQIDDVTCVIQKNSCLQGTRKQLPWVRHADAERRHRAGGLVAGLTPRQVCVDVRMNACVDVRMYARMHACVDVRIYAGMYMAVRSYERMLSRYVSRCLGM